MSKTKLLSIVLAVALITSICANIYLVNQTLNNQTDPAKTRVDMVATLTAAQTSINSAVRRIGESLIYASEQLSTAGISGAQAETILTALAANSSFIINAATENLDNTIVAVAPANWSYIEGRNVGEQTYLNPNPIGEITPVMSPVVPVQSDTMGNIMAAPIFNHEKELIGYISVIFDPSTLISTSALGALANKPYELIGMQLDGLMIYDSDPAQQWRNMFTDPAYASFTSLLELGHKVVDAPSGYGTYSFNLIDSSQVVSKECYWTTVTAYGEEWRLALNHALT
jgi:eukaryotic-like serine/threonine-protein kinase